MTHGVLGMSTWGVQESDNQEPHRHQIDQRTGHPRCVQLIANT